MTHSEKTKAMTLSAVTDWEEVPSFESEADEAHYWSNHSINLRLMQDSVVSGSESSESVTITLRMDPKMLSKIKRLARSRYINYQSMIKQWLAERMEKEMWVGEDPQRSTEI
jgi:hypothetical protein